MKNRFIKTSFLLILSFMVYNCSHDAIEEQPKITEAELIGEWRSSNTFINGKPIEDYMEQYYSIWNLMGLKDDGRYYFNYNSGEWKLENNKILLENERDFKIIEYKDGVLTLEAEIFASQTYLVLDGIESDELVTIQEDFRKH
jgi:hypothetical protein